MRFSTFMGELLSGARRDEQGNYLLRDPCMTDSAGVRLNVEELALFSAIDLLASAGLRSPFDPECLKEIAVKAKDYLDNFDLTGIE